MKKIVFLLPLWFYLSANAQVKFTHSYQEAKNLASETKKNMILMDFTATWCGPCKMMAKKVFSKEEVGNLVNTKFIPLKLDVDTPEGGKFSEQYQVESIPTIIVVDLRGQVIKRLEGYFNADKLLSELQNIP